MKYWYSRYGIPDDIVSDRDPRLTSEYWSLVAKRLGFKRRFSTAYHPQTDGSTERVNRSILQILRSVLDRKTQSLWVQKLPEVEFSYNSRIHSTTGMTPFQAHMGFNPSYGDLDPKQQGKPLAQRLQELSVTSKRKREQIETQYNKRRKDTVKYAIGDQVLLDTEAYRKNDAQANVSKKLSSRYQGPYSVTETLPHDTYRLNLPPGSRMHNGFHTSVLKPYIFSPRGKFPTRDKIPTRPGPIQPDEPDLYEVESITSHD